MSSKDHFDGLRASHHVKIRENVAARVNQKSGAGSFHRNWVHKEIIFCGLGENIGDRGRCFAIDAYVDGLIFGEVAGMLHDFRRGASRSHRGLRDWHSQVAGLNFLGLMRAVARSNPISAED